MQRGRVGIGRTDVNILQRLRRRLHSCVVSDKIAAAAAALAAHSFADRMLSAMRKSFGGHIEPRE